jgi:hypothetical protein
MGAESLRPLILMREKEVMLSKQEHRQLTNLKQQNYPEHTPFGFIIGELVEEELHE